MSQDTGGPAFPGKICVGHLDQGDRESPIYEHPLGMTLLDHYAGEALQGIVGNADTLREITRKVGERDNREKFFPGIAAIAFEYAEAMITEKRRREGE